MAPERPVMPRRVEAQNCLFIFLNSSTSRCGSPSKSRRASRRLRHPCGWITDVPHLLFSFGTLRQQDVQLSVFGRKLHGRADRLPGFRLTTVRVTDPEVIRISGSDLHPMLEASADESDCVDGMVFEITDAELEAADAYEEDSYVRASVTLTSGATSWVYLPAEVPTQR